MEEFERMIRAHTSYTKAIRAFEKRSKLSVCHSNYIQLGGSGRNHKFCDNNLIDVTEEVFPDTKFKLEYRFTHNDKRFLWLEEGE